MIPCSGNCGTLIEKNETWQITRKPNDAPEYVTMRTFDEHMHLCNKCFRVAMGVVEEIRTKRKQSS